MTWSRKGMAKLAGKGLAGKLAQNIDKEDFLKQLKEAWHQYVKKTTPIEQELAAAMNRINRTNSSRKVFETVGITEDDIRTVLEEIREEKVDSVKYEQKKVGRNELCPCGSGKKYKRCCGK